MSMLAERRQRKRYNLVPRGKALYEDESRFGTKMLEKMGWKKGEGLGASSDGTKDFVRIRYKNDSLGLGFENRDDQWTQHEQHFSGLLKTLNNEENDDNIKKDSKGYEEEMPSRIGFGFQDTSTKEETKSKNEKLKEKISGISLEEKSKKSKARVHYKKFTKGKDLAQYSEKDLANIFGKKAIDEQQEVNDFYKNLNNVFGIIEADTNENQLNGTVNDSDSTTKADINKKKKKKKHCDNEVDANQVDQQNTQNKTYNSNLSVQEYFKMKMEAFKKRKTLPSNENELNDPCNEEPKDELKKKKKKSKKQVQDLENEILQVSSEKKSKKSKKKTEQKDDAEIEMHKEPQIVEKKKKSKKRKIEETVEGKKSEEENLVNNGAREPIAKKSRKMKSNNENERDVAREKKSKKNKIEDDAVNFLTNLSVENSNAGKISLEVTDSENTKNKKKKKDKKASKAIIEVLGSDENVPLNSEKQPLEEKTNTVTAEKSQISNSSNICSVSTKNPKTNVSSSANNICENDVDFQLIDLEELKKKHDALNIYQISSFCAEKFRNVNLNDFKGSSIPQLEGYGLSPDLQLEIVTNQNDEERITKLWKCVLDKYEQPDRPKKTYNTYVRDAYAAFKKKQKPPKFHVKTWKRKNAFNVI